MPSADLTARMYFDQGRQQYGQQNYDSAADHFKHAVDQDPMFEEAHRYLAESYQKLGYSHRARKAYEALLRITTDEKIQQEIRARLNEL